MKKHFLVGASLACANLAQAHEGHGMPGLSHWHASDVLLALGAVAALGLWLARRK